MRSISSNESDSMQVVGSKQDEGIYPGRQPSKASESLRRERSVEWRCHYYEVSEPEWGARAGGSRKRILVTYRGTDYINEHVKNK